MEIPKKIFGETVNLSGTTAVELLECGISEGVTLAADGAANHGTHRVFGREPQISTSDDLSYLTGMAANGLRTGGVIEWEKLSGAFPALQEMARQHLPVVVFAGGKMTFGHAGFYALSGTGCFQMMAGTVQQAVDFMLIAHRVAELSLIPGMVALDTETKQEVTFPAGKDVVEFLGGPDDQIPAPTPAQNIAFGDTRRRLPNYYSFDFANLLGAQKDANAAELEAAAQQPYFYQHLDSIFKQVFEEFEALTGRHYEPLLPQHTSKADYLLLAAGSACEKAARAMNNLSGKNKNKMGCVQVVTLSPFPGAELPVKVRGKKAVTILENTGGLVAGDSLFFEKTNNAIRSGGNKAPAIFRGYCGHELTADEAAGVFENMTAGNDAKPVFYTGINFTKASTGYPQHEILLQTIRREYPDLENTTLGAAAKKGSPDGSKTPRQASLPLVVRKHKNKGPAYTKLSRFYHDTAFFYQNDEPAEQVASPFSGLSVVPAATASLSNVSATRQALPSFESGACTGCGACFVECPHAAIPPIAIGMEAFLRGGMDIATKRGLSTAKLTPLVKNLAKVAAQVIRSSEEPATSPPDFLPQAFEKLTGQMKLSGEKLGAAQQDFGNLMEAIGTFPTAITNTFFKKQETLEKGSGELFSLAIDLHSCTGCGICAAVCDEGALNMLPTESGVDAATGSAFDLWEQLPDTSSETIRRLLHDEDYDSFAAILLSRHNYLSMTGGNDGEHAGAKAILHLFTALTESLVQPGMVQWSAKIGELANELSGKIQEKLGEALPGEESHALWKAIAEASGRRLPLDEIVGKLSREEHLKLVDTDALQRKLDLVNELKELQWVLTEGPNGLGRSRYGLAVLNEGLPWAGKFPFNPFLAPAFLPADGLTPELARGLFQGYLRHALDNIRLLRRAKLEVNDKYQAGVHAAQIASLDWEGITEEEKQLVPPLLLVGEAQALDASAQTALLELLGTEWPIKIVLLDPAGCDAGERVSEQIAAANVLLLQALAWRKAFVFKSAVSDSKNMFTGLVKGLRQPGPALFSLLAPANEKHLTANWTTLPRLGLCTRAFPVFGHIPEKKAGLLATSISLEGNPSPAENWHSEPMNYVEDGEEKVVNYSLTYADWLLTQKAWQSEFRPAAPDEKTTPLADYQTLDDAARNGILPVVFVVNETRELQKLVASPKVLEAAEEALSQWNTLREIAGTLTPYPEKLWKEAEAALTKKYEEKMATLKAEYEKEMARQKTDFMEEAKVKLREKLLALSQQKIPQE